MAHVRGLVSRRTLSSLIRHLEMTSATLGWLAGASGSHWATARPAARPPRQGRSFRPTAAAAPAGSSSVEAAREQHRQQQLSRAHRSQPVESADRIAQVQQRAAEIDEVKRSERFGANVV
jgi:hypothetical protein